MPNPFGIGDLPSMGLPGSSPGSGGLFDTMEAMRKAWGSFALPPSMAPTIDPDELERRVAELKTVEQWLVMNLTMLRGTIQALEIQQHTLTAMHAFGATGKAMMSAMPAAAQAPASAAPSRTAAVEGSAGPSQGWPHFSLQQAPRQAPDRANAPPPPAFAAPNANAGNAGSAPVADALGQVPGMNPMAWWDALQQQFNQVATAALASAPAPTEAGNARIPQAPRQAPDRAEAPPPPAFAAPDANAGNATSAPVADALGQVPGMNPMAWWDTLQQQFNQVAAAALANMPAPTDAGKTKARARAKAKAPAGAAGASSKRKIQTFRRRLAAGSGGKKRAAGSSPRRPTSES